MRTNTIMSIVSTLVFKQILKRWFTLWHLINTSNSFQSINLNMRVKRSTIFFSFRLKWRLVFYIYHFNRKNVREISGFFGEFLDISLASMIIELWGFFSVPHIFEHETSVCNVISGKLNIKPLTQCLAKKKKMPQFIRIFMFATKSARTLLFCLQLDRYFRVLM